MYLLLMRYTSGSQGEEKFQILKISEFLFHITSSEESKFSFIPTQNEKNNTSQKMKFLRNINCRNFKCPLKSIAFS